MKRKLVKRHTSLEMHLLLMSGFNLTLKRNNPPLYII